MYVGRVEIAFDAGHRILGHKGKCASPHGHTFRAEVFVVASELDELGFVRDFGELKAPLKAWIDLHWDHGFLVNDADVALVQAFAGVPEAKVYCFRGSNPSAEGMARELYVEARHMLGAVVDRVRVWESPSQYAEYAGTSRSVPASYVVDASR